MVDKNMSESKQEVIRKVGIQRRKGLLKSEEMEATG
jgi:hypothetical protein